MKTCLVTILSATVALNTLAQYRGPILTTPGYSLVTGNTMRNSYGAGTTQWADDRANSFSGSWAFDGTGHTLNEVYAGTAQFALGSNSGSTTRLWIHGNVSGYLAVASNNPGSEHSGQTVTVTMEDSATMTSSLRALLMRDQDNANDQTGNWNLVGGNYVSSGFEALLGFNLSSLTIDGVNFTAGGTGKSAVQVHTGGVTIQNTSGREGIVYEASTAGSTVGSGVYASTSLNISGGNAQFIASQGNSSMSVTDIDDNFSGQSAAANGVAGAGTLGAGTLNGGSYSFYGSEGGYSLAGGNSATASSSGGHGAQFGTGNGTVSNSLFRAATGGEAEITTVTYLTDSKTYATTANSAAAYAHGGSGLYTGSGTRTLINVEAYGASGGSATANYTNNYADASGGNGVYTLGSLTVTDGEYIGAQGGTANTALGDEAYAFGGSGIFAGGASGTVIINGGTFEAGRSGRANGQTFADGAAITQLGGALTINGGTFDSTGQKTSIVHGNALWLDETDVTITEDYAETVINGNILMVNDSANQVAFNAGTINGDIIKIGSGATALSISNSATYTGAFIQDGGAVNVTLGSEDESKFFSNVTIYDGDMSFTGQRVITADNASFVMSSTNNNTLAFNNGVTLSKGSKISGGFNTITSGGDLVLGDNAEIGTSYNALTGARGLIDITGALVATNSGTKIKAGGPSDTPNGTYEVVKATAATVLGANDVNDVLDADFGWLTMIDTNLTDTSAGITVTYEYSSLTNSSLSDLGTVLTNVDAAILGTTTTNFHSLNSLGAKNGDKLFRFSLSQIPDVSESSFQISQQLNEQIAARGTEFRSMNGFASSKPNFGSNQPTGVAGPENELDEEKTMQGWVRAYGGKGTKDATGNFAEYDTTSWGSVIGVDKSFGNLLVGLAGGYARTDLDAGSAYQADIDTYHGSVYSTFGGESLFIDVALTYGWSSTDEKNDLSESSFDSSLFSAYIGAGYAFDLGEKLAITPEASLLASYYSQDGYDRTVDTLGNGFVEEYDTTSVLGSIGVNLATQHQLDWLNRGIAFIPEARAHYIHEFNADPDDFTYVIGGTPTPFAVRSRDENLFRFGFGFDMWSWKYQNMKFEIDYDALMSDTYFEHIVSGKATWRF